MLSSWGELCAPGFAHLPKLCRPPAELTALKELERRHAHARRDMGNCAVVGASGSLVNSSLGARIDSFASVIRVNRAPTAGWERDVGYRTSLRVMAADGLALTRVYRTHESNRTFEAAMRRRPEETIVVGCYGPFRGRCDAQRLLKNIHPLLHTYMLSPVVARRAASRAHANQRSPPTGMMAVEFALASCTNVTLFGFATPSCLHPSACYHYYSRSCHSKEADMRHRGFSAGFHDFNAQEDTLADLERRSLITRVSSCQINRRGHGQRTLQRLRHGQRISPIGSGAGDGGGSPSSPAFRGPREDRGDSTPSPRRVYGGVAGPTEGRLHPRRRSSGEGATVFRSRSRTVVK